MEKQISIVCFSYLSKRVVQISVKYIWLYDLHSAHIQRQLITSVSKRLLWLIYDNTVSNLYNGERNSKDKNLHEKAFYLNIYTRKKIILIESHRQKPNVR